MWDRADIVYLYFTTLKDNTFLLLSTQAPFSQQKITIFIMPLILCTRVYSGLKVMGASV